MNIVWKDKRKGIGKSGDLLLTRRNSDAITVSYDVDATPSKMLKMGNKKIVLLMFLFILCACKEKENKTATRDVLLPQLDNASDTDENRVDSIVLEYTNIDSITQFVRRIGYSKALGLGPDTINYKIINKKTKAYVEFPRDTIKSIYLDTETFDIIVRIFESPVKSLNGKLRPPPLPSRLEGSLQYINSQKDSINNTTYYVFKGNDVGFSEDDKDGYFYFDSIFHLKKVYSDEGVLVYSVNYPVPSSP